MKNFILFLCMLISCNCYGIDYEKFKSFSKSVILEVGLTRSLAVLDLLNRTKNPIHQENLKTIFLVEIKINEEKCKKRIVSLKESIESNEDVLNKCDEIYREDLIIALNEIKIEVANLEEVYIYLCEIQREMLNE